MIDPATITEIRQFVARYGPGNVWTGTVGTACKYIRMLLDDAAGDELTITDEWLSAIGFRDEGMNGWSKLLPPRDDKCAIAALYIEGHESEWFANLAQGVPDDPHVPDDIVSLTSLPEKLTRRHVRRLLDAFGVK